MHSPNGHACGKNSWSSSHNMQGLELPIDSMGGRTNRADRISRSNSSGDGGVHGSVRDCLRGIYLQPTVFMVGGTATHLMQVLYAYNNNNNNNNNNNSTDSSPGIRTTRTREKSKWWGCRYSDFPDLWVTFEYTPYQFSTLSTEMRVIGNSSDKYMEEEIAPEPPENLRPPALDQWIETAKELSRSLRENRLSAKFRAECSLHSDKPLKGQSMSVVIRGGGGVLPPPSSCLIPGVEFAIRAMRPGDEFSFIIMNRKIDIESLRSQHRISLHNSRGSSLEVVMHVRIKLLKCFPREPVFLPILQKYVAEKLPSTQRELEDDNVHVPSNHVFNNLHPARFFGSSFLFTNPSNSTLAEEMRYQNDHHHSHGFVLAYACILFNSLSTGVYLPPQQPSSSSAMLFSDDKSRTSLGFSLDAGKVHHIQGEFMDTEDISDRSPCGVHTAQWPTGRDNLTQNEEEEAHDGAGCGRHCDTRDEEALAFLNHYFFSVTRDGATVSFCVTKRSPLTDRWSTTSHFTDVELGSMALPLWLDFFLQTMDKGEMDYVNMCSSCEDDAAIQCLFAGFWMNRWMKTSPQRNTIMMMMTDPSYDTPMEFHGEQSRTTDAFLSTPLHSSRYMTPLGLSVASAYDADGVGGGGTASASDEVNFTIQLADFVNVHDKQSFFFVDAKNSLRVVKRLKREAKALCTLAAASTADNGQYGNYDDYDDDSNDSNDNECRRGLSEEEELYESSTQRTTRNDSTGNDNDDNVKNLPSSATVKPIRVYPQPFFVHTPRFLAERAVVKAIQKMNLALFFLTFNVNERDMLDKGALPAFMQQRFVEVINVLSSIGRLYSKLHRKEAITFALETFSIAILLASSNAMLWFHRGVLRRQMHDVVKAMNDFSRAKSLAEEALRRITSSNDKRIHEDSNDDGGSKAVAGEKEEEFSAKKEEMQLRRILFDAESHLNELRSLCGERYTRAAL